LVLGIILALISHVLCWDFALHELAAGIQYFDHQHRA
jgi:hypothetical protein